MTAKKVLRGVLKDSFIEAPIEEELVDKSYGMIEGDKLLLDLWEAAYLVDRGDLEVTDETGNILNFKELVKRGALDDPLFWTKLLVYSDLRNRGLRAKVTKSSMPIILVSKKVRDSEKRYMVVCLEEGVRISFKEIEAMVKRAYESRRDLVFAIVDKEGNVSYYSVEKVMGVGK